MPQKIERCPKCGSQYVQYDSTTNECVCLIVDCGCRFIIHKAKKDILNDYLRISIYNDKI